MKKITFGWICILVLLMSNNVFASTVSAAGWGYKKSNDNQPPNVGEYGDMLKDHDAIYRDDTEEKVLYFTFDNGYEQGHTAKILDVLHKYHVPATFFVTGHYVKSEPDLVKRMADEGHIIGNHSYHHPDFTKISKEKMKKELDQLEETVADITDQDTMHYVRAPSGTFNDETLTWSDELGYTNVFWSLAFKDWHTDKQHGWKYAYDQVMEQVHPGAIVLLHTVSEDNADALEKIIQQLGKDGYTFKSLDELMVKQTLPEDIFEMVVN